MITHIFAATDCFTQTNMNWAEVIQLVLLPNSKYRNSRPEMFCKKGGLKNSLQEYTCARVSFLIKLQVSGLELH